MSFSWGCRAPGNKANTRICELRSLKGGIGGESGGKGEPRSTGFELVPSVDDAEEVEKAK